MTHVYTKEDLLKLGRAELRKAHGLTNTGDISDEFLVAQIEVFAREVEAEIGYEPVYEPGSPGYNAVRYYGLIRAAFYGENAGPTSISHARRYDYGDERLRYWRDRMIHALNDC